MLRAATSVNGTLLQGFEEDEGSALLGATLVEVQGIKYLYALHTNGAIVKVHRSKFCN